MVSTINKTFFIILLCTVLTPDYFTLYTHGSRRGPVADSLSSEIAVGQKKRDVLAERAPEEDC